MRCKKCGWPNKPSETVCVKCGSALESEPQVADNFNGGSGYSPQPIGYESDGLKKTVMENDVFGPSSEMPGPETPTVQEKTCPKCGYPMRADATKCPNCSYSPTASAASHGSVGDSDGGGYRRRPTRMSSDPDDEEVYVPKKTRKATNSGAFSGTINPYMMNYQAEPAFVLSPIQRMNERKPIEPVELEGVEVILTRDNTEPGNPTISSKEQAVITHAEGRWYIEDASDQKTTFVQAAHKTELHDGDIILLGNRLFKFMEQ